jgi:tRNA 2-thiouridine synthesizing protein A
VLVVTSTDPLAAIDIPNLIRETGDVLKDQAKTGASLIFTIEKC